MIKVLKRGLAVFLVLLITFLGMPLNGFMGLDLPSFSEMFSVRASAKGAVTSNNEQEILDGLGINPYNLIDNIDLGSGEIKLPTLTINGKEYDLGKIDASFKLPLGDGIDYKINTEEKTIEFLGGVDLGDSATIGPDGQSTTYWSEAYRDVKNLYTNVTGKKVSTTDLWNKFSSLRGQVKKFDCSMGISVSAKSTLFVKISYEKDKWEFVEGGVVVAVSAGVELSAPVASVFYVGLGLEPSIGGKLSFKKGSEKVVVGGEINGEIAASIFLGVGDKKVTKSYIEGRVTGTIEAKYTLPAKTLAEGFSAKMNAKVSAEAKVMGYKVYSGEWDLTEMQLYPEVEVIKPLMFFSARPGEIEPNYDDATIMSRAYSTEVQSALSSFYLGDIYSCAEPKLISLPNRQLMLVWVGDDGTKNTENRTSLFYSLYDGYQWSESIKICENEEFNSSPVIAVNDSEVYIIWQKTSSPIAEGVEFTEILKKIDLYYTKYTSSGFTEPIVVNENNELIEFGHTVVSSENGAYVIWYENSENDVFMDVGSTMLKYSFIDNDGNIGTPIEVTGTGNSILTYNPVIIDGKLNLAISAQEDGKNYLKLYDGSTINVIAESDTFIGNVLYHDGRVVYLSGTNVIGYDLSSKIETIFFENFLGSFEIINSEDKSYFVTANSDYDGSSVRVSEYDSFSRLFNPLNEYYRTDRYINDYSAAVLNNNCMVAIETSDFDAESEEMFSNYSLEVIGETEYNEIEVGTYAWTNDEIVRGNNIKIGFDVKNTGNTVVDSLNYSLVDVATGDVLGAGTINEEFAVNEYKTLELDYAVPNDFMAKEIRIDVSINSDENDLSDNYAIAELGQADLEIKAIDLDYEEGKFLLKGTLSNNGYKTATGNILRIYDTSTSGALISEISAADLQSISSSEFVLELPERYAYKADEDEYHAIYVTVSGDADEYDLANNEIRIIYNDKTWDDIIESNQEYGGFELGLIKDISEGFFYNNPSVDIKQYKISRYSSSDLLNAFTQYYVAEYGEDIIGSFKCSVTYNRFTDSIVKLKFAYEPYADSTSPIEYIDAETDTIDFIKNETKNMNDFEKALYVHDWLILNGEYDFELAELNDNGLSEEDTEQRYLQFGLLVLGKGVCGTYGYAYEYLMNALGIECQYLSSSNMNHAWNLIKLDNEWYHVDCTWDDPTKDRVGISRYDYFLVNDAEITEKEHSQWTPSDTKSVSTVYSNIPRADSNIVAYGEDKWCYVFEDKLYVSDVYGNNEKLISEEKYDAFDIYGGYVYAIKNKSVYRIDVEAPFESYSLYSLKQKPKSIYIDEAGILTYYTSEEKSFEIINVNDLSPINEVKFSENSITADNANTIELKATAYNESGELYFDMNQFTWSTSDEGVASVDENGVVTPDLPGTAVITASIGDIEAECIITVKYWERDISGSCGENAIWSYDIKKKELSINGSGAMNDYPNMRTPWVKYANHIESVSIGSEIQKIGESAFENLTKLNNIVIPSNVNEISEYAFFGCSALEEITLPFIGSSAEANGTKDAVFGHIFGSVVRSYEEGTIQYYKLKENNLYGYNYAIPKSLKKVTITDAEIIPFGAFYNCNNLTEIVLNEGVTQISGYAFAHADSLVDVKIPKTVMSIDEYAFYGCNAITSLTLPFIGSSRVASETYDAVLGYVFGRVATGSPDSTIQVYDHSYSYAYAIPSSLRKVVLTDADIIPSGAFHNCSNIYSIILNEGISTIGQYAFVNTSSITELIVPNSVQSIEEATFLGCTSLEKLTIPFVGSSRTASETYDAVFGYIFGRTNSTGVVQYFNGSQGYYYAIPDSLRYVVLTDDELVPMYAFYNCRNIISVVLNEGITTIGEFAFANMESITELTIPKSVNTIGQGALNKCISLETLTIPFVGSSRDVTGTVYSVLGYIFGRANDESGVNQCYYYENGSYSFYNYAIPVSLKNIVVTDDPTIALGAFSNCNSLSTVEFKSATESIENCAFYEVDSLDKLIIRNKQCNIYDSSNCIGISGTIYGYPNSTAETFANKYSITFVPLEYETHEHSGGVANCTEQAMCSYCGLTYGELNPDSHKNIVTDRAEAATCSKTGLTEGSHCDACGKVIVAQIVIDKLAHTYSAKIVEPTCTVNGYTTYTCVCGDTYVDDEVAALDHSFTWIVDEEATCGTDGKKHEKCVRCDATRSMNTVIPATGEHSYTSKVTTPATHLKEGVETFTCFGCGDSYTKVIEKLTDHSYSKKVTEPTCTAKGYTTYTCVCGDTYIADYTDVLEHNWGDWITTNKATCLAEGEEKKECSDCDAYKTRKTNTLVHSYTGEYKWNNGADSKTHSQKCVNGCGAYGLETECTFNKVVTDPTCYVNGFTTYTCTVCSGNYISDYTTRNHDLTYTADNGTSHIVSCKYENCDYTATENCSGGTAYCNSLAICEKCNTAWGEKVADNHASIETYVKNDKTASCSEAGYTGDIYHKCCDALMKKGETIAKLPHTEATREENRIEASCGADGSYDLVTYCSVCDEVIKTESQIIPATGTHNYATEVDGTRITATCKKTGTVTFKCGCGATEVRTLEIDVDNHEKLVKDEAVAATCSSTGLTEGKHCDACGVITIKQTETEMLDHTPSEAIEENRVEPKCETKGSYDEVVYCSVCKTQISRIEKEIDATGHSFSKIITLPTCTKEGYSTYTCDCGDSYISDYVDATGHSYTSEITTPATSTSEGVKTYTCSCGYTYAEVIPKLTIEVGAIIQFGSYPQSEVKDATLIAELNALAPSWDNWISYGYYNGVGNYQSSGNYESATQGDWMRYYDVELNGAKYRGVKFTQYRPDRTHHESSTSTTNQDNNGYYTNVIYWFKFESLEWKILDPHTGLVMCTTIIDAQPYNNTVYYTSDEGGYTYSWFKDSSRSYFASDYETSTIREWLNDDFYNTAFSESEMKNINVSSLNNNSYNTLLGNEGYEKLDSKATNDKILLLSYDDVRNSDYGFNSTATDEDVARKLQGSDYAKSQNLFVYSNTSSMSGYGYSYWHLRTPGSLSDRSCLVFPFGYTDSAYPNAYQTNYGVCPALCLDNIAHQHTYTSEITTQPTHLTEGLKTFSCVCGASYTEPVAKLSGHMYEKVVTAPTCTENGYTTYTCACGDSYVADYVDANGHSHTSEITTPATHLTDGVMTYTCTCGDSYTEVIAKTTEHTYEAVVTAPTCTEKGYTTYTCACGDTYVADYVDANGHSYTSEITTPATHLAEGVMTFTCTCGDMYTEVIAKTTEHTYNAEVIPPTCISEGFTVYTCECGNSYVDDLTGFSDHADDDGDEFCDSCDEFLGSDSESNCSHMCHQSGFMGFIWKIVRFFLKLFNMTPVCECGVAHY